MKKYLLIVILYLCCINAHGQSINLLNLTNLTSLNNAQAGETLLAGKAFKLQYGQEINGFVVEHYQTTAPANNLETVIIGDGFKMASGAVLHTASYVTANPQHIVNLISQTKGINLKETFRGADKQDNIYIYDSYLYHVIMRINFNQTRGSIDVSQKQVFAE
jgi:hypothetical protein